MLWIRLTRAPFFSASIVPVLVGSAMGFLAAGTFNVLLFAMALVSIVLLHAAANIANDYFDHTSGNDWVNKNYNPFSGGSRLIQDDLIRPRTVLIASWLCLAAASITGIAIVIITRSTFILVLGIAGLAGGYFYTAGPLRLGYRGIGEILIAFLFGILPVWGSYFLQTGTIDLKPAASAAIIAMLVFLIILTNEFADADADAAVNKRTIIVLSGAKKAAIVYVVVSAASYVVAAAAIVFQPATRTAMCLYMLTAPLAAAAVFYLKTDAVNNSGRFRPNKLTILLHLAGGLLITAGLVIA